MEDFKIEFADFLAKTYILSDMPKEESSNLWTKFNTIVLPNIPAQLFRFRPCNLDSILKETLYQHVSPVSSRTDTIHQYLSTKDTYVITLRHSTMLEELMRSITPKNPGRYTIY